MYSLPKNVYRERIDFSKIKTTVPIPNLIEIQKKSYERFLQMNRLASEREDAGLQSVFKSVFPISDFRENSSLEFIEYSIGNWECKCGKLQGLHHLRKPCAGCGSAERRPYGDASAVPALAAARPSSKGDVSKLLPIPSALKLKYNRLRVPGAAFPRRALRSRSVCRDLGKTLRPREYIRTSSSRMSISATPADDRERHFHSTARRVSSGSPLNLAGAFFHSDDKTCSVRNIPVPRSWSISSTTENLLYVPLNGSGALASVFRAPSACAARRDHPDFSTRSRRSTSKDSTSWPSGEPRRLAGKDISIPSPHTILRAEDPNRHCGAAQCQLRSIEFRCPSSRARSPRPYRQSGDGLSHPRPMKNHAARVVGWWALEHSIVRIRRSSPTEMSSDHLGDSEEDPIHTRRAS